MYSIPATLSFFVNISYLFQDLMSKKIIIIISTFVVALLCYGIFAVFSYTQAKKDPVAMHIVTGKIVQLADLPMKPWGLQADWTWGRPIGNRKFRFIDLPKANQVPGQSVRVEYQIQDVIGGEWGVVIHIVNIKKH